MGPWEFLHKKTVYDIPQLDEAQEGEVVTFVDGDTKREFRARYEHRNPINDMLFVRWADHPQLAIQFSVGKRQVKGIDDSRVVLDRRLESLSPSFHYFLPTGEYNQVLVKSLGARK